MSNKKGDIRRERERAQSVDCAQAVALSSNQLGGPFNIFFFFNFSLPQFRNEAALENMCGSAGARSSGFKAREQALCSRCHKPVSFTHFILVCD